MFVEEKLIKYLLLKNNIRNFNIYYKLSTNSKLKKLLLELLIKKREKIFDILDENSKILSYVEKTNNEEIIDSIIETLIFNLREYLWYF